MPHSATQPDTKCCLQFYRAFSSMIDAFVLASACLRSNRIKGSRRRLLIFHAERDNRQTHTVISPLGHRLGCR